MKDLSLILTGGLSYFYKSEEIDGFANNSFTADLEAAIRYKIIKLSFVHFSVPFQSDGGLNFITLSAEFSLW